MKILYFIFLLIISFNLFAETYSCEYKELDRLKKFTLDRVTHSHFKKCFDDECEAQKLSVIFADNDNIIIGDIINKDKNEKNFFIFIINKNTYLFSAAKIQLPNNDTENFNFTGKCLKN